MDFTDQMTPKEYQTKRDDARKRVICSLLAEIGNERNPREFQGFFMGAIFANVVGNMSDRYFEEFVKPSPCGLAGCDCHLQMEKFLTALRDLRRDHKMFCPKEIAE